jgi:RNA processing factor Prp31
MTSTLPPKLEPDGQQEKNEMYDIVICNYEEREKELVQENLFLRQLLYDFYRYLETKTSHELEQLGESVPEELESHNSIHQAIFQLPLEMMRETVLASIEKSLEHLVQVFRATGSHDDELVELQHRLEESEANVQELRSLLDKKVEFTSQTMAERMTQEMKHKFEELELRQKQLEDDRKRFGDAAIKLGLERAALKREKAQIQDGKELFNPAVSFPSTPT